MDRRTVAAATLGCKVNFYETEGVLEAFRRNGYEVKDFSSSAAVYIVNTCAVTGESGKKSRQAVSRARKRNPGAVVAVIGCYSQLSPDDIKRLGADIIIGTNDRASVVGLVEKFLIDAQKINAVASVEDVVYENLPVLGMTERCRAFVKIQDGCENFCSYCVIPLARGKVRSRPLADIKDEVTAIAKKGYKEIVLTGIHTASYGKDFNDVSLIDAVRLACETDGISRVRLGSVDPAFVTRGFVDGLAALGKVCSHFHLPLQSGNDATLTRMNRRYDTATYRAAAELFREYFVDVSITTDVIVGFPGETDKEFSESCSFIESMQLSRLHVFPFSIREGTAAANFDGKVKPSVINERKAVMLALGERLVNDYRKRFIGRKLEVLIEEKLFKNTYRGLTENYLDVEVESETDIINDIVIGCFYG
jgi:threonylcarbamoyladenosine tRNA methylthiotransferase MtaB